MADKRHIVFLSVPETLRGQIESLSSDSENGFSIDPEIPIPAEIPNGEEKLNLEELSWEMIIAGMLSVIAAGEEKEEWINYYRHFVVTVRPAIMNEFTEAAILKARNGDFDLALEILDALRGLFPFSPAVRLNRALVMEERASALERRNTAEATEAFPAAEAAAAEAYAEALALDPPFPDIQFNAGFFYLGRKDFHRAKECFSRYVDIADNAAYTAADAAAHADEKIKQAQALIKDINNSGLEDTDFTEAYRLIRQGNEEKGMQHIREFIEKYPAVWNGWFILGWALRRLNRWADGAAAFGKAIELGGGSGDTRNELAICLMETGDLHGARRELETALRDDPENVKIISNMGVLAMKNGNPDEAAAFFRTVLELDPEDPIVRELGFAKRDEFPT